MRGLRLRAVVVEGESMTPTLRPGDCLLVLAGARLRVGDVALARRPSRGLAASAGAVRELLLVKRVARRVDGGWWLLSDNAAAGLDDSRAFGVLSDADVVGRVVLRYYPWRRGRPGVWGGRGRRRRDRRLRVRT
ncbi:MAG: S24/S26 family peptidase [Acidothermaceae bacterium]